MKLNMQYPIVGCEDLDETRVFYGLLGFDTLFSDCTYAQMVWPGAPLTQIGLVMATKDTPLPFQSRYRGGMFLALDVRDVDAAYADLKSKGLDIATDIETAPWGQRHFVVLDPNGVAIDITQTVRADAADVNRALEDA